MSGHNLSAHTVCVKTARRLLLPGSARDVSKDSFSEAGLLTRNNANKAVVCAVVLVETSDRGADKYGLANGF